MNEMTAKLSNIDGNALLVMYGLHLVPAVYVSKESNLLKLFDVLEDDLTWPSWYPSKYTGISSCFFQELHNSDKKDWH